MNDYILRSESCVDCVYAKKITKMTCTYIAKQSLVGHLPPIEQEYSGYKCDVMYEYPIARSFSNLEDMHRFCPLIKEDCE